MTLSNGYLYYSVYSAQQIDDSVIRWIFLNIAPNEKSIDIAKTACTFSVRSHGIGISIEIPAICSNFLSSIVTATIQTANGSYPFVLHLTFQDFSDVLRSSLVYDTPKCQSPESEIGKAITEVDYVVACSDPEIVDPEPASDQTALIISLTIVLAVLLFGVVMLIVLRQSKKRSKHGSLSTCWQRLSS